MPLRTAEPAFRALAESAKAGEPLHRLTETAGRWEPYFTTHGDPYVCEQGRGLMAVVATVSTSPGDYGRARAEFIAAADPVTVLRLLDEVDNLRAGKLALIRENKRLSDLVARLSPGWKP